MKLKRIVLMIALLGALALGTAIAPARAVALCDCIANPNCSGMCPNQPPPCGGLWQPPCS